MRPLILAALLAVSQHLLVSAKAGMVTHINGRANYVVPQRVPEGGLLTTESNTWIELMLTPDAYVRMGSRSRLRVESAKLHQVELRLLEGQLVLEAERLDRRRPFTIRTGGREYRIPEPGFYRISEVEAVTHLGRIEIVDGGAPIEKGWRTWRDGDTWQRARIVYLLPDPLESYSVGRSVQIYEPTRRNMTRAGRPIERTVSVMIRELFQR